MSEATKADGASATSIAFWDSVRLYPANTGTDKARGIAMLSESGLLSGPSALLRTREQAVEADERIAEVLPPETSGFMLIMRACPPSANHGGFPTVVMRQGVSILKYFDEACDAVPGSEVLLMPFVKPDASGILTRRGITLGSGHDGATAGHGITILPRSPRLDTKTGFPGNSPFSLVAEKVGSVRAGITCFFEFVMRSGKARSNPYPQRSVEVVQARIGPDVSVTLCDTFYRDERCKRVLDSTGVEDLEWSDMVAAAEGEEGVIAFIPGRSSTSHHAVHCDLRKVSYVSTGAMPVVGAEYTKTAEPTTVDAGRFMRGYMLGLCGPLSTEDDSVRAAIRVLVYVTHNCREVSVSQPELLGLAAATMLRVGSAAVFGEARHARGFFTGERGWESAPTPVYDILDGMEDPRGAKARQLVFGETFGMDYHVYRKFLPWVARAFKARGWSSGYGGAKWLFCTQTLVNIDRAVAAVAASSAPDANAVVAAVNDAVNAAHNNGWWLNKFVENSMFDLYAKGDPEADILAATSARPFQLEVAARDAFGTWGEVVRRGAHTKPLRCVTHPWVLEHEHAVAPVVEVDEDEGSEESEESYLFDEQAAADEAVSAGPKFVQLGALGPGFPYEPVGPVGVQWRPTGDHSLHYQVGWGGKYHAFNIKVGECEYAHMEASYNLMRKRGLCLKSLAFSDTAYVPAVVTARNVGNALCLDVTLMQRHYDQPASGLSTTSILTDQPYVEGEFRPTDWPVKPSTWDGETCPEIDPEIVSEGIEKVRASHAENQRRYLAGKSSKYAVKAEPSPGQLPPGLIASNPVVLGAGPPTEQVLGAAKPKGTVFAEGGEPYMALGQAVSGYWGTVGQEGDLTTIRWRTASGLFVNYSSYEFDSLAADFHLGFSGDHTHPVMARVANAAAVGSNLGGGCNLLNVGPGAWDPGGLMLYGAVDDPALWAYDGPYRGHEAEDCACMFCRAVAGSNSGGHCLPKFVESMTGGEGLGITNYTNSGDPGWLRDGFETLQHAAMLRAFAERKTGAPLFIRRAAAYSAGLMLGRWCTSMKWMGNKVLAAAATASGRIKHPAWGDVANVARPGVGRVAILMRALAGGLNGEPAAAAEAEVNTFLFDLALLSSDYTSEELDNIVYPPLPASS